MIDFEDLVRGDLQRAGGDADLGLDVGEIVRAGGRQVTRRRVLQTGLGVGAATVAGGTALLLRDRGSGTSPAPVGATLVSPAEPSVSAVASTTASSAWASATLRLDEGGTSATVVRIDVLTAALDDPNPAEPR